MKLNQTAGEGCHYETRRCKRCGIEYLYSPALQNSTVIESTEDLCVRCVYDEIYNTQHKDTTGEH